MQKASTIAVLGPAGTYSTEAATRYDSKLQQRLCSSITDVLTMVVAGECSEGIVPYENSIQGIVTETLDGLYAKRLVVHDEVLLDVHHSLYATKNAGEPHAIRRIYSHPQALAQCRNYVTRHYPVAELVVMPSTAAGIKHLLNHGSPDEMAIGPSFAAVHYGLELIDQNIEDEKANQTRFFVCSRQHQPASTLDFSMIALVPESDSAGLLYSILGIIAKQGINLTQIESRPQRTHLGSYMFYLRLDVPASDERIPGLAEELKSLRVNLVKMSR